tara:strand:+ start:4365 stop:5327 length:963 start_codon:yes stop_codon:yes gene_type:complete
MQKDKILITGAAGFIGFHLSKSLLDDGYQVFGLDNINNYYDINLKHSRLNLLKKYSNFTFEKIDISDRDNLLKVFLNFSPNKVVNLAAQAGVRYSIDNPHVYVESNIKGFLNIIELCRHNNVDGLIYASSSSVYGGNSKFPFSVEDRTDNPISLYAATKKSNELIANCYSELYDLHTTGLRFFTVYGPYGRPDMAYFKFSKNIYNGKVINIYNHGNMKRDFTYIDDIILGTRAAIDKNYKNEIFNLGNSKSEKLMDLVNLIEQNLNKKAKINMDSMQPGDVEETFADIDSSKKMLNFSPKTNLNDGISLFVDWFKEYHKD